MGGAISRARMAIGLPSPMMVRIIPRHPTLLVCVLLAILPEAIESTWTSRFQMDLQANGSVSTSTHPKGTALCDDSWRVYTGVATSCCNVESVQYRYDACFVTATSRPVSRSYEVSHIYKRRRGAADLDTYTTTRFRPPTGPRTSNWLLGRELQSGANLPCPMRVGLRFVQRSRHLGSASEPRPIPQTGLIMQPLPPYLLIVHVSPAPSASSFAGPSELCRRALYRSRPEPGLPSSNAGEKC